MQPEKKQSCISHSPKNITYNKKRGHRKKNATSSAGLKFHRELLLSGVPLAHAQGGQAMANPHN